MAWKTKGVQYTTREAHDGGGGRGILGATGNMPIEFGPFEFVDSKDGSKRLLRYTATVALEGEDFGKELRDWRNLDGEVKKTGRPKVFHVADLAVSVGELSADDASDFLEEVCTGEESVLEYLNENVKGKVGYALILEKINPDRQNPAKKYVNFEIASILPKAQYDEWVERTGGKLRPLSPQAMKVLEVNASESADRVQKDAEAVQKAQGSASAQSFA